MEMQLAQYSPAWLMLLAAFVLPLVKAPVRNYAMLAVPVVVLWHIWSIPQEVVTVMNFAGFELIPVRMHDYTLIFATVFAIAAFGGVLFGMFQAGRREQFGALLYAGSAIGVTFAGDFISFFIYWELMAIGSTIVVWSGDSPKASAAGMRYAAMHFFGGAILMAGIIAHIGIAGGAEIRSFEASSNMWTYITALDRHTMAMWLIFIGVLVNIAAPPFSAWLPDSYPESSPFGAVFLSAFTTKTAVFTLLTLFPGNIMLIYIGLFMVFYGIVMAILENDMRRILAYSVINQVGFMVTGIGIGTTMALQGAAAHAFCHIIYKALLFMSAGSVLYITGKSKCTELGGLYRTMPLTAVCGIIGALAISAFPLTSGFVSKSMISSAAIQEHMPIVWALLAAASAGVFLHAGIKFPWFVFFQKDAKLEAKDPPINMQIAMVILAAMCIIPALPGLAEVLLYPMLPVAVDYVPYTGAHVVTQLQLLLFSGLAFFLLLPLLRRTNTITLDIDWLYRVAMLRLAIWGEFLAFGLVKLIKHRIHLAYRWVHCRISYAYSSTGIIGGGWLIGVSVIWTVMLLAILLLVYFAANAKLNLLF